MANSIVDYGNITSQASKIECVVDGQQTDVNTALNDLNSNLDEVKNNLVEWVDVSSSFENINYGSNNPVCTAFYNDALKLVNITGHCYPQQANKWNDVISIKNDKYIPKKNVNFPYSATGGTARGGLVVEQKVVDIFPSLANTPYFYNVIYPI